MPITEIIEWSAFLQLEHEQQIERQRQPAKDLPEKIARFSSFLDAMAANQRR